MSKLVDRQSKFLLMVCSLIQWSTSKGYTVTGGELWRTPEQAKLNASRGLGIVNSLHCERCAIDLNFFREGKMLTGREYLAEVGAYWESLGGRWGGRFKKYDDSGHFELP